MRETGYYRVKYNGQWNIMLYMKNYGTGWICHDGVAGEHVDADFEEIIEETIHADPKA